jgi:hypothetical protein
VTDAPAPSASHRLHEDAPAFTLDDAIDFHFLLQDDSLIADLLADGR